jgi:hypothetical protein
MNPVYYAVLILLFLSDTAQAVEKKPTITSELLELRGELMQAGERIVQLKKDKASIDQSFKALEDWAVAQQKEKIEIYEENEKCRASLSYAEQKIVAEKTEHKKTSDKYYRIKSFMGYLAGAFLALLYLRVGSTILAALLSSVGPWGFILQFLGPVGAFAAGYFLVQLYF